MFDTADVLIHRQPVVGRLRVDHALVIVRAGVAGEVPGRLDEGVHGVGFALGWCAAFRARAYVELGHPGQRRAGAIRHHVFGQHHRQLVFRHRHIATAVAVDDRDRAAPVALAADTPVTQAELGTRLAEALLLQRHFDGIEGAFEIQAVVDPGVDQLAALAVGVLPGGGCLVAGTGAYHRLDRQAVLAGKFEVALVMRRHGHDRALAVVHQHVVGDPYRQQLAGQRVLHAQGGGEALLLLGGDVGFGDAAALALIDEGLQLGVVLRRQGGQRMLGGDGHVGRTHQRIGAGGEDLHHTFAADAGDVVGEADLHAARLADPVALHGLDLLGPAVQLVQTLQQLIRVGGDLEVVHRDFALLDQRARTPATAVDDLLVGQHGLVDRVPVHRAVLAVDHALLEQTGEQPLFPAVVVRLAGGDFARPVDGQAQAFQLGLHVGDVLVSPFGRRHLVLHRGVFGRHAEGVPAHRLQHVLALHALVAGDHVADGVVAHVAHVQLAAGVGEHRQAIEGVLAGLFAHFKGFLRIPVGLRGGFDLAGLILFVHGYWRWVGAGSPRMRWRRRGRQVRRTLCKRDPADGGRRHGSAVAYMTPSSLGKPDLPSAPWVPSVVSGLSGPG